MSDLKIWTVQEIKDYKLMNPLNVQPWLDSKMISEVQHLQVVEDLKGEVKSNYILRITTLMDERKALQKEITELEEQVEELGSATTEDCVLEMQNSEIEELKSKLAKAEKDRDSWAEESMAYQNQVDSLKAQLDKYREAL